MSPAVSVITAARDYGQYLGDTLRSVQRQTFTDWELILVDDGSRDQTPEVVRSFQNDTRIRYIRTEAVGQTRTKSLSLRLSRAPLIAYLDGDDLWLPTKLERQVRLLNAEPELGVVFTRRFLINGASELIASNHATFHRGMIFNDVLLDNFVCYSSTMVRREIMERVGALDNRLDLAVDYDLWLRVARHYRFDYIDEPLVKYRTGHSNLSQRIIDRIQLVLSVIRRSMLRRGNGALTPEAIQREAWGSTCRTMGFVQRDRQPAISAAWYLRAACFDRKWMGTLRAVSRGLWKWVRSRGWK